MGLVAVTVTVCYLFTTAVPELSGAVLLGTFVPDPQPALASGSFFKQIYVDMNKLKVHIKTCKMN